MALWEILGFSSGVTSFREALKKRNTTERHTCLWRSPPKRKGAIFSVGCQGGFFLLFPFHCGSLSDLFFLVCVTPHFQLSHLIDLSMN